MSRGTSRFLLRLARVLSLAVLAMVGTIVLVRIAPGYFTDSREMDPQTGSLAREQLQAEQQREGSVAATIWRDLRAWSHGNLGRSRHFDVPVSELVRERGRTTARLLLTSVLCGWLGALALALPLSVMRTRAGQALLTPFVAILLATPVAALATACLLADFGGPVLVLSLLIGARDFQLVHSLLRHVLRAPHFFYGRAQGISSSRLVRSHLFPAVGPEMLSLAMTSFVLALSAAVPVEVIFDVPGLGQLAWNAAMNRDLPVLLVVTLLMACAVGVASLFVDGQRAAEAAPVRVTAFLLLLVLTVSAVLIVVRSPFGYADQDREHIAATGSALHPAGTDDLGRDRMVRTAAALLLGLTGAAAASAVATCLAVGVGVGAAFSRPWLGRTVLYLSDLALTLPWLFLLLIVRSALPLNMSPAKSAALTFLLLGLLGWPAFTRVNHARATALRGAEWLVHGRANGLRPVQLVRQMLPHLRPLILSQWIIYLPICIVAEANLGALGLGVSEPLASWGSLLLSLQSSAVLASTHWVYLPIALLVLVLLLLETLSSEVRS